MKTGRIFWGLALVLCALCLIFNQFAIFNTFGVWTIVFTILGAAVLLDGIFRLSMGKAVFGGAILLFLWKDMIGLEDLSIWTIAIAAILLGSGLSILLHPLHKRKAHKNAEKYLKQAAGGDQHFNYTSHIKIERHFGGGMEYIRSNDFKRADIEAHFSGLKIYFDDAVIQDDCATLHMDVHFSGVELFVPSEWLIDNRLEAFAGAVEMEPRRNEIAATKTLKLKGDVAFGSVKIIYF